MTFTDREDFERKLNQIFDTFRLISREVVIHALATNDLIIIQEYINFNNECANRISFYLTEYDNAPTTEDKEAVVGSVTGDIPA